jgi:hypothetical protein
LKKSYKDDNFRLNCSIKENIREINEFREEKNINQIKEEWMLPMNDNFNPVPRLLSGKESPV